MFVRLKRDWPGKFARSVGSERIVFAPGEPVEVSPEQFEALRPDLGKALEFGELVKGRFEAQEVPAVADAASVRKAPRSKAKPAAEPAAA